MLVSLTRKWLLIKTFKKPNNFDSHKGLQGSSLSHAEFSQHMTIKHNGFLHFGYATLSFGGQKFFKC